MPQGSYFGEIELLDSKPRDFTVLAEGSVEVFVMSKQLFSNALSRWPKVAEKMRKIAEERKVKNFEA